MPRPSHVVSPSCRAAGCRSRRDASTSGPSGRRSTLFGAQLNRSAVAADAAESATHPPGNPGTQGTRQPRASAPASPQRVEDLALAREPSAVVFGPDALVVHRHDEDAAGAADELGVHAQFLLDLSRQTGGSGKVVSNAAVVDPYVHVSSLSPGWPSRCRGRPARWPRRSAADMPSAGRRFPSRAGGSLLPEPCQ